MTLRLINLAASAAILIGAVQAASAQPQSWLKIAPTGESFTVIMPTQAVESSRLIPLADKGFIHERVFQSVSAGKRFIVAAFVKTTADRVPDLSNFNNFALAIKRSFEGREPPAVFAFERDLSSSSDQAKQYRLTLGEFPGIVRLLETEKAFYALIAVGADENNADVQTFFSSFAAGKPNAATKETNVTVDSPSSVAELDLRLAMPPEPWPRSGSPIMGGVLNGKAVNLEVPKYPKEARKAHQSGQVTVKVLIDEQGVVIWAEAAEGPDGLREAAVAAARHSRFTPTRLMGQPVKVNGVIIYNFVAQ
jgi:TonB family protein